MKRSLTLILAGLLALACGPKKTTPAAPAVRDFPMAEIPVMFTEPQERMEWLSEHFWDRFTATDSLYRCDSTTINGVTKDDVEKQVGLFAGILEQAPLSVGSKAMAACYNRLEAFQLAKPQGNVFQEVSALITRYFYDPNSPLRNEELYLPFVTRLADSPLVEPSMKPAYAWDAQMCSLNRIGTPAADFPFVDTAGKRRTLYGVKAFRTLLIFGNPDCHACKEIMEDMNSYPEITQMIADGRLKVVDIYIDEDIPLWKERMASYPKDWINGYDPSFTIRTDRIYSVRAVPSLYLLDQDKKVLQKDALPQHILEILLGN